MRARALMYHDVVDTGGARSGFEGPGPDVYKIGSERFREHLDRIERATGAPPLRAAELAAGRPGWLLTFDDGGTGAIAAGEALAKRSWAGHFFIATDLVGTPGFLDWDEIRALAAMGHVVGSHSCSHPDRMADLSPDALLDEWSRSAAVLSSELGQDVSTASVPGGLYSPAVGRAAARAGFSSLFISLPSQRVGSVDGCIVIGRYAIRRDTTAERAAAAAAGDRRTWMDQRLPWALRAAAKRVAGRRYERVRRALLARGAGPGAP
jgi:peptidoglycan/xylan/chitin deacetylase (PgdA/CDA1 family)